MENILHISRTMGQGGAEKIVYQIVSHEIPNVRQMVASTGGVFGKKLENRGIRSFLIPDIASKNIFLIIKTFFILGKIIKTQHIRIIHSHHRMAAFYAQLIYLFNPSIHLVYTAHNVFFDKKILTRFALKHTKIIAVGNGVKNNLINQYQIHENRITVIYNSVYVEKNTTIRDHGSHRQKYVAVIGRLTEQKGIDIFLKAFSLLDLQSLGVQGYIIGSGEDRIKLEQLAEKLKINKYIKFWGYQENVSLLIKQSEFVILPSRWEGFPLTPIETFAQSRTIIASNIAGNNEIVENNVNGLLFEKNNFEDLAKKIFNLLTDLDMRKSLESHAYIDYCNKYSFQAFLHAYEKVYEEIVDDK